MPLQNVDNTIQLYTNNTGNQTYDYNLSRTPSKNPVSAVSVQVIYFDTTPVHKTFVAANVTITPTNTITITAHGFFTGLKVALTGTNLPTGLSATNYWVIVVNANTIKLATSLGNANNGVAVTISGAGTTADADLTPAVLSQSVKLQCSNDGINFADIGGATVTITASGNTMFDCGSPSYKILRIVNTATSGSTTLSFAFNALNF